MKQLPMHVLHLDEPVASSPEWQRVQSDLAYAVASIFWPPGNNQFVINPVEKGSGVVPIRKAFEENLVVRGWKRQTRSVPTVGKVDAALSTSIGTFAVEWETGNISSSHRSLNRLSLGLANGSLIGGIVVLPTRKLYNYITDRIGNLEELAKYFPIYATASLPNCVFVVIPVEQDAEDPNVPLIPKGTDGRALR
jgi:hypothetical protein